MSFNIRTQWKLIYNDILVANDYNLCFIYEYVPFVLH